MLFLKLLLAIVTLAFIWFLFHAIKNWVDTRRLTLKESPEPHEQCPWCFELFPVLPEYRHENEIICPNCGKEFNDLRT